MGAENAVQLSQHALFKFVEQMQHHHLSTDTHTPHKQKLPNNLHHQHLPPHLKNIAQNIQNKFSVVKKFQTQILSLTCTQQSLIQFVQAFIKCIKKIGKGQTQQDKRIVKKLFTISKVSAIKQEKLFFSDLLKQLQKYKNKDEITQANKSRIYHEIANIKKQINFESKIQGNSYGLKVQKTYQYKRLYDIQMDQVVKLQHIAAQIQALGQIIKFKLDSARKQTESITLFLSNTFFKYAELISKLKYDLSMQEVVFMANVSRQACEDYENGVYLLVVYFMRCMCTLQKQHNQKVSDIEYRLNGAINFISKKYPPGQNLQQADLKYTQELQKLKLKQRNFVPKPSYLKPQHKKQQLEAIIHQYATIAKQCKPFLQTLVKQTCLEDCLSFRLGLKYNIDNPNPKALTRIIEKMLFKNQTENQKEFNPTSIQQQIKKQEKEYQNKIQQQLKTVQSISFKISDMVRGKCIFNYIEDIIQTVYKIKKYVADNASSYRIIEVESRFANKTPISDITLKILLKQKIVAQLQLSLQTNLTTYTFAHKIYEFSRSKIFSKIKTIDNYYKQFQSQFSQMVQQRLKLAQSNHSDLQHDKYSLNIKKCTSKARQYFDLDQNATNKSFRQLLEAELLRPQNEGIQGRLWADEQLQDLILTVFCISTGQWGSSLGHKINNILLKPNHSPIFKSTLTYFLYTNINTEEDFQSTKQFQHKRKRQIIQEQSNKGQFKQQIIQFSEYIKSFFGVKEASKYHNSNARIFYMFKNLSAMIDCHYTKKRTYHDYIHQIDRIYGQKSKQTIGSLYNFAIVCLLRKQYGCFQAVCKWSIDLIRQTYQKEGSKKAENIANIQFLMAQNYLQQNRNKEAAELLNKIVMLYKEKEDYKRQIQCDLMLVECKIKQQYNPYYIQQYKNLYAKLLQNAKVKGILLKGRTVADTEWRIAQKCWQIATNTNDKQMQRATLDYHYRRAMVLFSTYNVQKCVIASNRISWNEFKKHQLINPQLRQNKLTFILDLQRNNRRLFRKVYYDRRLLISQQSQHSQTQRAIPQPKQNRKPRFPQFDQCQLAQPYPTGLSQQLNNRLRLQVSHQSQLAQPHQPPPQQELHRHPRLPKSKSSRLAKHNSAQSNQVGNQGCRQLGLAKWCHLRQLILGDNQIGGTGALHLSSADWPKLSQIVLENNQIGNQGCRYLKNANWLNLSLLALGCNQIGSQGCSYLISANWPNLIQLNLEWNSIGNEGCRFLKNSNWPSLKQLNLGWNLIGSQGCKYLSNADWVNLSILNLDSNRIGSQGCQYLKDAVWPRLSQLFLMKQHNQKIRLLTLEKCKLVLSHLTGCGKQFNQKIRLLIFGECQVVKFQFIVPKQIDFYQYYNSIGNYGCYHLKNSKWNDLTKLYLRKNSIGSQGCSYLKDSNWPSLSELNISLNQIGNHGCQHLKYAKWPNLIQLDLGYNLIDGEGSQYLRTANWPNLSELYLEGNDLQTKDIQLLKNAIWPSSICIMSKV